MGRKDVFFEQTMLYSDIMRSNNKGILGNSVIKGKVARLNFAP